MLAKPNVGTFTSGWPSQVRCLRPSGGRCAGPPSAPKPPTPVSTAEAAGATAAASSCWVTAYTDDSFGTHEIGFFFRDMLSGVYSACGCNVELRQRSLFASDARSGMVTCAAVIHAGGSVSAEEIAAMHERPDMAKQRVISVALSDEGERYDISAYNYSRSAWRNYLSDTNPLRRGDVSYLSDAGPSAGSPAQPWGTPGPTTPRLRGAGSGSPEPGSRSPDHESRTFWFPLGYSQMFTSLPTLNLPTRMRALVWSWSGSIGFKPARQQFVDAVFEYSAVNLLDFGTLTTFDYFNDKANQKQPSEFSRLVLCPSLRRVPSTSGTWTPWGSGCCGCGTGERAPRCCIAPSRTRSSWRSWRRCKPTTRPC